MNNHVILHPLCSSRRKSWREEEGRKNRGSQLSLAEIAKGSNDQVAPLSARSARSQESLCIRQGVLSGKRGRASDGEAKAVGFCVADHPALPPLQSVPTRKSPGGVWPPFRGGVNSCECWQEISRKVGGVPAKFRANPCGRPREVRLTLPL
jgi:hypothetical protein